MHALSGFMRVFETPVDVYGRISVLAHDDAGVGTAYERPATFTWACEQLRLHVFLRNYIR
jgi:hypothetical protein